MGYLLQVPSQLSSHLRALRKAKGLSQAELGKRLGLSQARMARIEGDPLAISVEQLLQVFVALGVQLILQPQSAVDPPGTSADDKTASGDW
jgi:HTH-type transcriptional regulator/antitoxin HipB